MNSAVVPTSHTGHTGHNDDNDDNMPGNNNTCQTPPRSFSNQGDSNHPPCIKMAHRLAKKKKQCNDLTPTPLSEIESHITAQVIALLD